MALTRVSGRVVYPHGNDTPTPVTGDGVIEYVHATPGIIDGAVHGPDRKRIEYVAGVAEDAWLKPGMWRAYVYPVQGRSYTLHLGVPEGGETTIADAVGEIVPEGTITRGEQGPPGASVTGGRDNGDGTVSFELSDGTFTDPVTVPPGPAGRGIASISDPDSDSRVTITFTDDSTATVQAIRGADGRTPAITWEGTSIVVDGEQGPDLKGEPGADSTVPGPAPTVSWDGDRLVVEGVTGPSLTGPDGPAPTVAWSGDRLVVGGVQGPPLTGPASTVPGPPGAVPTASDYLVVGPGRPDAPTTTGLSSAQIAALPVGCEYRSTDGAGTGAWVWQKRPTGWVVTDGDTEWRIISDGSETGVLGKGYTLALRRTGPTVEMRLNVHQNPAAMPAYTFPSGFAPYATDLQRVMYRGGTTNITGHFRIWQSALTYTGAQNAVNATALETWTTSNPWPTTLTI